MTGDDPRPEVVGAILDAMVDLSLDSAQAAADADATRAELMSAFSLFALHADMSLGPAQRRLAVLEIAAPYIAQLGLGHSPMDEALRAVAELMPEEVLARYIEALRALEPGDFF